MKDGSGNTDAEFIAGNLDIQAKNGNYSCSLTGTYFQI